MSLYPKSSDDGPVRVTLRNGETHTFSRLRHYSSGMVTFYNVQRDDQDTRYEKANKANVIPADRIKEIEYMEYGGE